MKNKKELKVMLIIFSGLMAVVLFLSNLIVQKDAVAKAESYIRWLAFSKTGLVEQLEYEGYSNRIATHAVKSIEDKVDWKEECAQDAKEYLRILECDREKLYYMLEMEGYTPEEIEYGLQSVGY